MKRTIVLVAVLLSGLVLTSDVEGQRRKTPRQTQPKPPQSKPAPTPSAKQEKIVAVPEPVQEKMEEGAWQKFMLGQKVIILKVDPKRYGWGFRRFDKPLGTPGEADRVAEYVGRTGVIQELIIEKEDARSFGAFVVVLDGSGEKVVANLASLGLLAEMEIVKSYIGKSLWSGGVILVKGYGVGMGSDQIKQNSFLVEDTQRLVVTRAEWGDDSCPIYLCFKTVQAQEGCLDCGGWGEKTGRRCIIRKFSGGNFYLRDFYFEDPLTQPLTGSIQSAEQMVANLTRLKGTWEMTARYSTSGATVSSGGLSLSFGSTTIGPGEKVIEQPVPDIVKFNIGGGDYSFVLRYDVASKRYFLSAKKGDSPLIDNFALVYSDREGFIKAEPSKGGHRTGFSPKITFDDGGGHTWFIKPDFTVTFTRLKEGEPKNQ